ncbi:complex I intermediate-associated protein 30, mitochondrial-like isoform X2 [Penaeus japonicus]|uniref:complex I intermediate-associated protein 30, mitochondrial-like isoform X2 n=1 Tax=Penaeus japonicus TaxID=27405 RepID=UPI001C70F2B8|nr:complex I intermediate-associated protein 30, mitochondrial-like isoform X2 [Penaeus japonicus]
MLPLRWSHFQGGSGLVPWLRPSGSVTCRIPQQLHQENRNDNHQKRFFHVHSCKKYIFDDRKTFLKENLWPCSRISRTIATTPVKQLFWERDPKGGYGGKEKLNRKELIQEGLKELREELSKWKGEVKEKFEDDPIIVRPGDMDKVWTLKNEEHLKNWVVTSDKDHGEGYSSCSLALSPAGHGLFSGQINTQVPKDGRVRKSGYCNMKSIRPRMSFKREVYLDWSLYNHLELRVRGDGRTYLLNISTAGYFDLHWHDMYSYPLYTRGGPHWQITRIPFSKFFLSSKGRLQDKQCPIPLQRVVSLGVSAGDRVNAPFRLEIDYIGVYSDPDHTEEFAYEMYKLPKYTVGQ